MLQNEAGNAKWDQQTSAPPSLPTFHFRLSQSLKPLHSAIRNPQWAASSLLVACCLLLALAAAPARAVDELPTLGAWGGQVWSVFIDEAVDPDTAYVCAGRRLVILNVADPANIVELGSIVFGRKVCDVKVRDGYAFVGAGDKPESFCVVDVSAPASPTLVWQFEVHLTSFKAIEVDLYGNYAFVRGGTGGNDLWAFDISDPAHPVVWPWQITAGEGYFGPCGIQIVGDLMYLVDSFWQLRVLDLSADPMHPTQLAVLPLPGGDVNEYGESIAVVGDYAYCTREYAGGGPAVVDISDPANPVALGMYPDANWAKDVAVAGDLAYVADWRGGYNQPGGLRILDVSDPSDPTLVNTVETHGAVWRVQLYGDRAYVGDDGEGLLIYDLSNPTAPMQVGHWHSPAYLRKAVRVGDLLYVTDQWNGFTILDVSDPARAEVVGIHQTSTASGRWGDNWAIEVRGDLAYLAAGFGGLEVVNVSNPAQPLLAGVFPFDAGLRACGLRLSGDICHVGVQPNVGGYLVNFDIADPADIVDVGFTWFLSAPLTIAPITGTGIARFARGSIGGHLTNANTIDPANPYEVFEAGPGGIDIASAGDAVYLANSSTSAGIGGVYAWTVHADGSATQTGSWTVPNRALYGVSVQGDRVYAINGGSSFYELDRDTLTLLTQAPVPGPRHVLASGRYAYVTSYAQGLTILELQAATPGDFTADGDCDLLDFAAFQVCFDGGLSSPGSECLFADLDNDGDIDADDFAAFAQSVQGPDVRVVDYGACCLPDGTCLDGITAWTCTNDYYGVYQGNGWLCATVSCGPGGACCLPVGSPCLQQVETACDAAGGDWQGEGTECSPALCGNYGACCMPEDGRCREVRSTACDSAGGIYQGDGVTCAETTCPFAYYSNEIDPMTSIIIPGAGVAVGDDLTLEGSAAARDLTYLNLRAYGNGGGDFDVTVELWTACPGNGGSVIPNTTFDFTDVPDDGYVYELTIDPVDPPVTIPGTVWMVATFSTSQAGWVIAKDAETGYTADLFGEDNAPWVCNYVFENHNPYAGFWANLRCVTGETKAGTGDGEHVQRIEAIEAPVGIRAFGTGHAVDGQGGKR